MKKRKDNKGRLLRTGESQRADGRYAYKYQDTYGNSHFVYSWLLEPYDLPPAGKKIGKSLREMEKQIRRDQEDEIIFNGNNMTVLELVERYLSQKVGVRHNTQANYNFVKNIIKNDPFGGVLIARVKLSDAKAWLIRLQQEGRGYSTVHTVRGVVRPAFQSAVDDDFIRKNPFNFPLATVVVNNSETREAITREQQRKFLAFVAQDKHFSKYYEGIFLLFHTGLRISEFVGLTLSDLDMKNKVINVDHQLQRTRDMHYVIEATKTANGVRQIPMTDEVYACCEKIIAKRKIVQDEPVLSGRKGFLYLDRNNMPMVALHWEKYLEHIVDKYNKIYREQMPKITPHVCRHTYCSNMAKSGMNPKTLQYLMGHSDISVTMNVYTHIKVEDARAELGRVNGE